MGPINAGHLDLICHRFMQWVSLSTDGRFQAGELSTCHSIQANGSAFTVGFGGSFDQTVDDGRSGSLRESF